MIVSLGILLVKNGKNSKKYKKKKPKYHSCNWRLP